MATSSAVVRAATPTPATPRAATATDAVGAATDSRGGDGAYGRRVASGRIVKRIGKSLTLDEECERIVSSHGPSDFDRISEALDRQFRTIHNRAQLLLGICGVLISAPASS